MSRANEPAAVRCGRLCLLRVLLCAFLLLSSTAEAANEPTQAPTIQGSGFHLGNFVLHLDLTSEFGYDNNVFLAKEEKDDSFLLRLGGGLEITNVDEREAADPAQRILLSLGANAGYYHYFIKSLDDNVGIGVNGEVTFRARPNFDLRLMEEFARDVRPFTDSVEGAKVSYANNRNSIGLDGVISSRGKGVLTTLGYTFSNTFFDDVAFRWATNFTHEGRGSLAWKFFPQSALVYDITVNAQSYPNAESSESINSSVNDSYQIINNVGFKGALTSNVTLTALVGYNVTLIDNFADVDGVTALLEAGWKPRPTILVQGGYQHAIDTAYSGNYQTGNRLYAGTDVLLFSRLLLGVQSSVGFEKSGPAYQADGFTPLGNTLHRKFVQIETGVNLECKVLRWMSIFAHSRYRANLTDFQLAPDAAITTIDPSAEFHQVEGWLGIKFFN